ncbi:ATP-binding protein [Chondromyces apiculatus]|uniref:histidine kinase n=1 Tax=Chondromyces apiculatus DSM 436 TaxID=1192034 RepID=A0A017SVN6_9BACT|nr:ATP-binding protein [Chondromyces apiculatus]EYF00665.1 Hypothetical protein CAP_0356 [Chondromyces apiculatus DSM 436]
MTLASLVASPRLRAELVAVVWELFSALLFISALLPAAFTTVWPAVLFVGSMAVSALVGGRLAHGGERGIAIAGVLRVVAWPLAATPLLSRAGSPGASSQVGLMVAALAFGLMAGGMRRAIYRWMLLPRGAAHATPSAGELRDQLAGGAMTAGVVGGHLMLVFIVAVLRTRSQVIFQAWVEVVPILALLGTFGFTAALWPATTSIARALATGEHLARGLAQAERLPDALATLNFVLWLVCISVGVIYVRPGPWSLGDALIQLGFGAMFAVGVSFYQRSWHRDAVAPVITALRERLGSAAGERTPGPALRLGQRLLRDFGLPLLFTGLLSLLATLGMYRTLANDVDFEELVGAITALFASFSLLVIAALGVVARAAGELSRPMGQLARAADVVARGKLDEAVPLLDGPAEVVVLGESVERMRESLSRNIAELEAERAGLEAKVEARTAELSRTLEELKRTQAALIHGERLATLGELAAGLAHEIYNPLNAIGGAAVPLTRISDELSAMDQAWMAAAEELSPERRQALEQRRQDIDVEAALEDLRGISTLVRRAVDRAARIVTNLKNFARAPGEAQPEDLHAGLEETLLLLGPRLRRAEIDVVRKYGELPPVVCRASEIHQVLMNLLVNAIQAIESRAAPTTLTREATGGEPRRSNQGRKEIRIETWREDDTVAIAVTDTGPGVPPGIAGRIFDPFFTTKPRDQGTGLGLSIATEIVRRHGGMLTLDSAAAAGARFICRLPMNVGRGTAAG